MPPEKVLWYVSAVVLGGVFLWVCWVLAKQKTPFQASAAEREKMLGSSAPPEGEAKSPVSASATEGEAPGAAPSERAKTDARAKEDAPAKEDVQEEEKEAEEEKPKAKGA